jgi:hypothetical protein
LFLNRRRDAFFERRRGAADSRRGQLLRAQTTWRGALNDSLRPRGGQQHERAGYYGRREKHADRRAPSTIEEN